MNNSNDGNVKLDWVELLAEALSKVAIQDFSGRPAGGTKWPYSDHHLNPNKTLH